MFKFANVQSGRIDACWNTLIYINIAIRTIVNTQTHNTLSFDIAINWFDVVESTKVK